MSIVRARTVMVAAVLALAPGALAQPDRGRPEPREPGPRGDMTADELRRFIRQRNATLDRQQKVLEESARMLDEGKSVEEVRAYMREEFVEDWGRRREAFRDDLRERIDGEGPEGRRARPGGPGGPEGGPPERGERREPTPDEVMSIIRDLNPRLYERLERVRAVDEEEFHDMLRGAGERVRRFIDEKRDFPDRFETRVQTMRVERQANEQARAVVAASEADRPALEATLRESVSRLFDLRAKSQADDIERLGARLDAARQRFERMESNRESFIERHTADLIERAEHGPEDRERMPPPEPPER